MLDSTNGCSAKRRKGKITMQEIQTTEDLLNAIVDIFGQSSFAYRNYLAGGKKFRFAQELKLFNGTALRLLSDYRTLLPIQLHKDADDLVDHYSEWTRKWENLAAEREYQADDIFVFENDATFPKQACQNIEEAQRKLNPPPDAP
jgi:hypothetical protein